MMVVQIPYFFMNILLLTTISIKINRFLIIFITLKMESACFIFYIGFPVFRLGQFSSGSTRIHKFTININKCVTQPCV